MLDELRCLQRLVVVWFIASAFLLGILVIQWIGGVYGEQGIEALLWFLPTLFPSLLLLIGLWANALKNKGDHVKEVTRSSFLFVFSVSICYFIAVASPILLQPFWWSQPIELLNYSNLFLAPFQGVTAAILGIFSAT